MWRGPARAAGLDGRPGYSLTLTLTLTLTPALALTLTLTLTLTLALALTLTRLERLPCSSAPKKPAEELSQLPRADGARPRPDP